MTVKPTTGAIVVSRLVAAALALALSWPVLGDRPRWSPMVATTPR